MKLATGRERTSGPVPATIHFWLIGSVFLRLREDGRTIKPAPIAGKVNADCRKDIITQTPKATEC